MVFFRLPKDHGLLFSNSKVKQKQAKILRYSAFIGKLNLSANVKLRIYNTYIRPIVEIFAICWNMHADVVKFQNQTISSIMGIPRTVGLEKVLSKLQVPSVEQTWQKIASKTIAGYGHTLPLIHARTHISIRS